MSKKDIFKVAFLVLSGLIVHWLCSEPAQEGIAYCVLGLFGGGAPKKAKAPVNIWKKKLPQIEGRFMLDYYKELIPKFSKLEAQLTPQLIKQGFSTGGQALTGLTALQKQAGITAEQQMANLRAKELETMASQSPLFRMLLGKLSPEQEAMVQASTAEAERASAAAQGVTPEERRMYEQTAREAYQASGRLGGNAAIAAEIMGRENVMAQKRAEADEARQRAFTQAGQFYTAPGLSMLGATPASYGAGSSLAGMGLSLGESMSPQFDYNMPINLGLMRGSALDRQKAQQSQMEAERSSARLGAIGSVIGLAAAPFTGGLSTALGATGLGSMLSGMGGGGAFSEAMAGLGSGSGYMAQGLPFGTQRATPVY